MTFALCKNLMSFSMKREIDSGNIDKIENALIKGVNPNEEFRMSWNEYRTLTRPLNYSIMKGRYAIARLLLEKGSDPNLKDYNGMTPLMNILNSSLHKETRSDMISLLIQVTDLSIIDQTGRNALHWAALFGSRAEYDAIYAAAPSLGDVRDNHALTPKMILKDRRFVRARE